MKTKTKIMILMFATIMFALIILPNKVFAGTYGDLTYQIDSDKTVRITECKKSATNVTIPSKIGGYNVVEISSSAFRDCKSLKTVNIPNTVKTIYYNAFSNCTSLQSIVIPDSVTLIDSDAFYNCTSLKTVTLPKNIKSIESGTFENCTSLQSITIPNNVTELKWGVFYGCSSLKSIKIPNNVTSISGCMFEGCSSLTDVTLPNKIKEIPIYAFKDCVKLETVKLPSSINQICYNAFQNCTSLKTLAIPNGVTTIGSTSFYGCSNLEKVVIPASVTDIYGNDTFYNCKKLTLWVENDSAAYRYALNNDIAYYIPINTKVSGVKAVSATKTDIKFSWKAKTKATGYYVWTYNYDTKKWEYYGKTKTNSITIKGLKSGQLCKIKVKAYRYADGTILAAPSCSTTYKTATKPSTVKTISTDSGSGKVKLKWSASKGATGYKIYMSTSKNGTYKAVKRVSGTKTTTITGLKSGQTYYFKIRAYKKVSGSDPERVYGYFSQPVSVKIK